MCRLRVVLAEPNRARYQFNPDLYSGDVVVKILVKALTAAPAPDFNLCLAFLGERWVRVPHGNCQA